MICEDSVIPYKLIYLWLNWRNFQRDVEFYWGGWGQINFFESQDNSAMNVELCSLFHISFIKQFIHDFKKSLCGIIDWSEFIYPRPGFTIKTYFKGGEKEFISVSVLSALLMIHPVLFWIGIWTTPFSTLSFPGLLWLQTIA